MKLQIVSDLHLEFAPIIIENNGAQGLILAGDICVASYFQRSEASPYFVRCQQWISFFEDVASKFEFVIYVLGNHEHYSGRFDRTKALLNEKLGHINNLYILDNSSVQFDGIRFVGTTLWTDFNRDSYSAKLAVQNGLNDYHLVQFDNTYRKLRPNDTYFYHQTALKAITDFTNSHKGKIVVVGHHAPSFKSIAEQYKSAGLINFGYYSDLENFIADRPKIALWAHGHVHNSNDYVIGDTRVVSNPRGYAKPSGDVENPLFNAGIIYEV